MDAPHGADDVYRRPNSALWRRCPDRTLVLSDGQVHTLAGPAADVWTWLEEPRRLDELLGLAREVYEEVVDADLIALLDRLESISALSRTPGRSQP